jgi:hypothetical protein
MYIRHITLLSLVDLPGEQVELIRPCWATTYRRPRTHACVRPPSPRPDTRVSSIPCLHTAGAASTPSPGVPQLVRPGCSQVEERRASSLLELDVSLAALGTCGGLVPAAGAGPSSLYHPRRLEQPPSRAAPIIVCTCSRQLRSPLHTGMAVNINAPLTVSPVSSYSPHVFVWWRSLSITRSARELSAHHSLLRCVVHDCQCILTVVDEAKS